MSRPIDYVRQLLNDRRTDLVFGESIANVPRSKCLIHLPPPSTGASRPPAVRLPNRETNTSKQTPRHRGTVLQVRRLREVMAPRHTCRYLEPR